MSLFGSIDSKLINNAHAHNVDNWCAIRCKRAFREISPCAQNVYGYRQARYFCRKVEKMTGFEQSWLHFWKRLFIFASSLLRHFVLKFRFGNTLSDVTTLIHCFYCYQTM